MGTHYTFDDNSAGRIESSILGMAEGGIQLIINKVEGFLVHVTIRQIGEFWHTIDRADLEARAKAVFARLPYEAVVTVLPNDQDILEKGLN